MKTTAQKEHWLTIYHWLKLCGSSPNQQFCREEITTHPDYPSLLSAVDFLDSGGMAYQAVRADASYIHEFNYPLLAHIKKPGEEYMYIVANAAAWDEQKETTQFWSGIAVYSEKDAVWRNSENTQYQLSAGRNKLIAVALSVIGLALFIASVRHLPNFPVNSFGLLSLAGLIISIYALGTELGFQSQLVKQVCGAVGGSGECEQVLKSSYAKGFAGITPADASVLYFTSQFLFYLVGCWRPGFLSFTLWISLAGIPIVAWSVYTQAVKLKLWCALCLGIAAVLLFQALMAIPALKSLVASQQTILPETTFLFIFSFLLALMILLPIKGLLKTNIRNKQKLAELKKWKLDSDLFVKLWLEERRIDTSIWQNDLLLGNRGEIDAEPVPLTITIACSPYCGPCAQVHEMLDEMLTRFAGKLHVVVRLLCDPEDENNRITAAVKAILQTAATVTTNSKLEEALTDWFAWMDYERWVAKWQPDRDTDVSKRLTQHDQWTKESEIAFTPTLFLNGLKIPGRYLTEDLTWLIPQLAENEMVTTLRVAAC